MQGRIVLTSWYEWSQVESGQHNASGLEQSPVEQFSPGTGSGELTDYLEIKMKFLPPDVNKLGQTSK